MLSRLSPRFDTVSLRFLINGGVRNVRILREGFGLKDLKFVDWPQQDWTGLIDEDEVNATATGSANGSGFLTVCIFSAWKLSKDNSSADWLRRCRSLWVVLSVKVKQKITFYRQTLVSIIKAIKLIRSIRYTICSSKHFLLKSLLKKCIVNICIMS
jgi:hypothetical protein